MFASPTEGKNNGDDMPNYRRIYTPSATYFFTVVTYDRQPLFQDEKACRLLREVIADVKRKWPFDLLAFVLLTNHLPTLWTMPEDNPNYSIRWRHIKANFSRQYQGPFKYSGNRSLSREWKQEQSIWQRRFWEHQVRNERDMENHFHYLHYNPIKHGLVTDLRDWKWSTYHHYVRKEWYPRDWGKIEPENLLDSCVGE